MISYESYLTSPDPAFYVSSSAFRTNRHPFQLLVTTHPGLYPYYVRINPQLQGPNRPTIKSVPGGTPHSYLHHDILYYLSYPGYGWRSLQDLQGLSTIHQAPLGLR